MRLLAFILDDLDAVLAKLDAAGRKHSSLPVPDSLPYRVSFSRDLEGNLLELVGLHKPAGDRSKARNLSLVARPKCPWCRPSFHPRT
jgi:hypothetical protein